ncbi:MAG: BON domain-containing protein [Burkholderiaceae bacterium]|nr:BON domain-containing protein [Burkholderiaceae bacterium]
MKTDAQLKRDVLAELEWDPSINATRVGVAVNDGVVLLTGHLDTFGEKQAVENAVQGVAGVKAIAVELDVKLEPHHQRSDAEIAAAIETAFKWHALVPEDRIQVKVEKGRVTLSGEVDWHYQRHNAELVVRPVTGVVGVSNNLTLREREASEYVTKRIQDALTRHAEEAAKNIEVVVEAGTATLRGTVATLAERSAVQAAAWSAPGISRVVNELKVQS